MTESPDAPNLQPQDPAEETIPGPSIADELAMFVRRLDAISDTYPLIVNALATAKSAARMTFSRFLRDHGTPIETTDGQKAFQVPLEHVREAADLRRAHESARHASQLIPQSLIVSLVSQYDHFLGRLIRCLYYIHPEALTGSDKSLTFAQLVNLGSVEAAQEYLLEKEIEAVLRSSHVDQFEWLERKYSVPLRKDLASWPTFVEVTERRNLFVHTNGVVSSQYLSVCRAHGVDIAADVSVGSELTTDEAYFQSAFNCVLEVAVKLAEVLWRKTAPSAMRDADVILTAVTYDLLLTENWALAIVLLEFANNTLKKHFSDEVRQIYIVNLAQAYKSTGRQEDCLALVDGQDWSSCSDKFQIAISVLKDDFDGAAEAMKRIGPDGEVKEHEYKEWPLFREFRKVPQFQSAFEAVFGHQFTSVEKSPTESG